MVAHVKRFAGPPSGLALLGAAWRCGPKFTGQTMSRYLSGLFISFEGIDGAGKSTHIGALAEHFRAQGRSVVVTREPVGTPLAEQLRVLLLNDAMDPMTESLLIFAARRDHLVNVIAPALRRGDVLLCDRFTDATFAYQGYGRGFDLRVLETLEKWVQFSEAWLGDPAGNHPMQPEVETVIEPHLTLWFDLAAEEAASRLQAARVPDRFEAEPLEFFRRVVQGYADRLQGHPERFARIDAAQPRDLVWENVRAACVAKGWLT